MNSTSPARPRVRLLTRLAAVIGALLLALGAGGAPAIAADKPTPNPSPGSGWIRVMHLSPDTAEAAVTLTAVSGGAQKTVSGVHFGDASKYLAVPPGNYVVAIKPAHSTRALLERSITIAKDQPLTMAVTGMGGKLATQLYTDQLATVPAEKAKVRIIQASSVHPTVTVRTRDGDDIAQDAGTGEATGYATVPAGAWPLTLRSGSTSVDATVTLPSGSTTTVLVMDNAKRTLTAKAVVDSEAVKAMPKGGINTGAAPASATGASPALPVGAAAVGGVVLAGALLARRRRSAGRG
ncbi:DUF4397 domain-containing protein [Tersicoccus sp. Bi-70]|uniref:DUF4397 domain-containing protein n=1 Tax=Tersicoccus sp. Bi-70 TaxID=1897634 RepID=UPI0009783390|nr:DUF4397 domain-containing protein [Tersicoccus sp. Bi-70]